MSLDSVQQAVQEQFGKQSHRYAKGHILEDTADVAAMMDGVGLQAGGEALDVATGAGHTAYWLARAGMRVTACDLTPGMLERVREGASERGLTVETRECAAERLPFEDGRFDIVTCRVAPHHFSSVPDFVREGARVLKGGGMLMVIDGSVPDDDPEAAEWLHQVEKLRDPSHNRLLAPREWRGLFEEAGLEVTRCEVSYRKQPDLEWYFETAATTEENRGKVRELIAMATAGVRESYRVGVEEGKVVWWWPMVGILGRKNSKSGRIAKSREGH
jgi:ubiquinone/menaquinone biosynthesis C-methylase UbiE